MPDEGYLHSAPTSTEQGTSSPEAVPTPRLSPLGGNQPLIPTAEKIFPTLESASKDFPVRDSNTLSVHNIFPDQSDQSKPLGFLMFGALSFIFLLIVSAFGVVYAIGYDYIGIDNPKMEQNIAHFIQNFSFMPKTADFLLEKSALAHMDLRQHSFDISLESSHPSLTSRLSTSSAVIKFTGSADYAQSQNPQISFVAIGKNINLDGVIANDNLFFRSHSLPPSFSYIPLQDWVRYDLIKHVSTLQDKLSEHKDQSVVDGLATFVSSMLLDEKVIKESTVTEEILDGTNVYLLHFEPNPSLIDYLGLETASKLKYSSPGFRPTNYITKVTLDIWVNKANYLIHQLILTGKANYDQNTQKQTTDERLVIKLGNYHQPVNIQPPSSATEYDQLLIQAPSASPASSTQTSY